MKLKLTSRLFSNSFPYYFISIFVCVVAVVSRLNFNGLVYGFDYGIFQPDGFYYSYQTLTYMGREHFSAATEVNNWYALYSAKPWGGGPVETLPEFSPLWGLVAPRILYPLLSVPFVALFGLTGMFAIPIIGLGILVLAIQYLSNKNSIPQAGLAINYLLLSSPTVLRWMVSNITDSLLCGLFALATVVIWKITQEPTNKRYVLLAVLIALTSLTRFSLPIWLAIGTVYLLNRNRRAAFLIFLSSTLIAIPTFLMGPDIAFLPEIGESSLLDKIIALPAKLLVIPSFELLQLAALDRVLLALILASFYISVRKIRQPVSHFYIATLTAVLAIGILNGTLGVNFRYQLPLIPFCAWVIINWAKDFRVSRNLNV